MLSLKKAIDNVLRLVCTAMFIFITCVGTYQIVTRYIFNSPSTVSEELLTYSFAWMALLAATYVFGKRDHMRMEYFAEKLNEKARIIVSLISELVVLSFSLIIMTYGGIAITKLTVTQVTASLGIPMAYVYSVVPICGVLMAVYNIINIIGISIQLRTGYNPISQQGGAKA